MHASLIGFCLGRPESLAKGDGYETACMEVCAGGPLKGVPSAPSLCSAVLMAAVEKACVTGSLAETQSTGCLCRATCYRSQCVECVAEGLFSDF